AADETATQIQRDFGYGPRAGKWVANDTARWAEDFDETRRDLLGEGGLIQRSQLGAHVAATDRNTEDVFRPGQLALGALATHLPHTLFVPLAELAAALVLGRLGDGFPVEVIPGLRALLEADHELPVVLEPVVPVVGAVLVPDAGSLTDAAPLVPLPHEPFDR